MGKKKNIVDNNENLNINTIESTNVFKNLKIKKQNNKYTNDSDSSISSDESDEIEIIEKRKRKTKKNLLEEQKKRELTVVINRNKIKNQTVSSLTLNRVENINKSLVEKYRPKNINNIMIDNTVRIKFENMITFRNIPNFIINGPSGTGKTTSIRCLAKQILGNIYQNALLELNASDNRGLDMIEIVKSFCEKKIDNYLHYDDIQHNKIKKIIIFDEADNITTKAQNILANMMDTYKNTTRFCFICNDSKEIIDAIQSRCTPIHFKPINHNLMEQRLKYICEQENIEYEETGIKALVFIAHGDMRKAINNLEATYNSFTYITEENIYKLCHQPHPSQIIQIIKKCASKNIIEVINNYHALKEKGYCNSDILQTLIATLKYVSIDERLRINYIMIISDTYIIINEGLDNALQMYACFSRLINFI